MIGAEHPGAGRPQRRDGLTRRMPVVVVRADRDQGDRRPDHGRQPLVLVARTVMRHFQHVGAQVDAAGEQGRLGRRLDIAGEQDPNAVHGCEQHEACVVRTGAFAGPTVNRIAGIGRSRRSRARRGRPHNLEPGGSEHADLTGCPDPDRNPGRGRQPPDLGSSRGRLGQRAHHDLVDGPAGQHAGQPVDVVRVEVGEHQQRYPVHAEPFQAGVDRGRIGAGIDDHGGTRTQWHCERIALSDVTRDDHPIRGRPAGRPEHVRAAEHEHETAD